MVAFKGPNVILGLYKCNYSLTRGKEFYIWPFEGNHEADVASSKNEFDNSDLMYRNQRKSIEMKKIIYSLKKDKTSQKSIKK